MFFFVKEIKGKQIKKLLYKNLPVKKKKEMAFLSKRLIHLALLLHGQFIHHKQISLYSNTQFFWHSAVCLSVTIELLPGLHQIGMLGKF